MLPRIALQAPIARLVSSSSEVLDGHCPGFESQVRIRGWLIRGQLLSSTEWMHSRADTTQVVKAAISILGKVVNGLNSRFADARKGGSSLSGGKIL